MQNEVLFTEGDWTIKDESSATPDSLQSYIYHTLCEAPRKYDSDNIGYDVWGWISAWDAKGGRCFYCQAEIPVGIMGLWMLKEADVLGGYMYTELDDREKL